MFSPKNFKTNFPIFQSHPDLIYFDNAATSQRPEVVIDCMLQFDRQSNANIRRGVYPLSSKATLKFEEARNAVAKFIGAPSSNTIAFTHGTTMSINIVARSYLERKLIPGQNIVISALEHHANLIPWQQLCLHSGARLDVIPIDQEGNLSLEKAAELIGENTAILALTHISNALGTIVPIKELIDLAHSKDVPVLIDAAQSACFYELSVRDLGCDFLAFSGHKMFGPFGVGILYVAPRFINEMEPFIFGGGIVKQVTYQNSDFLGYPQCMEVGTPSISGVIGLHAAINYLEKIDRNEVRQHLFNLAKYFRDQMDAIEKAYVVGNPNLYSGIVSFNLKGIHAHDVATFLGEDNIAVRAGHHCCQPLLHELSEAATVRASFSHYNEFDEIDKMIISLQKVIQYFE